MTSPGASPEPRALLPADPRVMKDTVSARPVETIHELSAPGGRPLCGADPALSSAPRHTPATPSCAACLRLLENDARRAAHLAAPRGDESED